MPPTWLLATCFLVGLALIRRGLKGQLVDDHPYCRRCSFDLIGAQSTMCPECGGNTEEPNSVRIGRRARHRRSMITGLSLAIGSLTIFVAEQTGALSRGGINQFKPLWLLCREIRSSGPEAALASSQEIMTRIGASGLSASEADTVLASLMTVHDSGRFGRAIAGPIISAIVIGDRGTSQGQGVFLKWALELQGDAKRPWNDDIGRAIEFLISNGKASPEALDRYSVQQYHLLIRMASTIPLQPGEKAPVYLQCLRRGGATSSRPTLHLGTEIKPNPASALTVPSGPDFEPIGFITAPKEPGEYKATAWVDISSSLLGQASLQPGAARTQRRIPLELTYQVEPPEPSALIRSSIGTMFWCTGATPLHMNGNILEAQVTLWVTPPEGSIRATFDVVWVYAGESNEVGRIDFKSDGSHYSYSISNSRAENLGNGYSHRSAEHPEQLILWAPVSAVGPEVGTLLVKVKHINRDPNRGESEVPPFTVELPNIPIRR